LARVPVGRPQDLVIATPHYSLSKVKKSVKSNITDYSLEGAVANALFFYAQITTLDHHRARVDRCVALVLFKTFFIFYIDIYILLIYNEYVNQRRSQK